MSALEPGEAGSLEPSLEALVDGVIKAWPSEFAYLRSGRAPHMGFLVGQVMRAARGQAEADPAQVQRILCRRLEE